MTNTNYKMASIFLALASLTLFMALFIREQKNPAMLLLMSIPLFFIASARLFWRFDADAWWGILLSFSAFAIGAFLAILLPFLTADALPLSVTAFFGMLFGAIPSFTDLPMYVCGISKRRGEERRRARLGKRYAMCYRHIPLVQMLSTPLSSYARLRPTGRVIRLVTSLLVFFWVILFCYVARDGYPFAYFAVVYCAVLTPLIFSDGFWRGALWALLYSAILLAAPLGAQALINVYRTHLAIAILLTVVLLFICLYLYRFAAILLYRRFSSATLTRSDSAQIVAFPISFRCDNGFTIPKPRHGTLWRAELSFEPFGNCEPYYFRRKWADLCLYCRLKGYSPIGFRAEQNTPVITYYLYAPEGKRTQKCLFRFFSAMRHEEVTVRAREDAELRALYAMLPSLSEAMHAYHDLFFDVVHPNVDRPYAIRHTVLFKTAEEAEIFLAEVSPLFIAARYEEETNPKADAVFAHRVALLEHMHVTEASVNARVDSMIEIAQKYKGEYFAWDAFPAEDLANDVIGASEEEVHEGEEYVADHVSAPTKDDDNGQPCDNEQLGDNDNNS